MNQYYEDTTASHPRQEALRFTALMLAYEAVENAKDTDPVKVRDELRKLNTDNRECSRFSTAMAILTMRPG